MGEEVGKPCVDAVLKGGEQGCGVGDEFCACGGAACFFKLDDGAAGEYVGFAARMAGDKRGEGFVALDGDALGVVFGAADLGEVVLLSELAVLIAAQDGVQDLGLGVLGAAQGGLVGGVGGGEEGGEGGHGVWVGVVDEVGFNLARCAAVYPFIPKSKIWTKGQGCLLEYRDEAA